MSRLAFIIVLLHWLVIGIGWSQHGQGNVLYDNLFYGAFLHVSPVMIVFNLIAMLGINYTGHLSALFWVGLVLAFVKYGSLAVAIKQDEMTGLNITTLLLETAYVAASGYYLFQLNII